MNIPDAFKNKEFAKLTVPANYDRRWTKDTSDDYNSECTESSDTRNDTDADSDISLRYPGRNGRGNLHEDTPFAGALSREVNLLLLQDAECDIDPMEPCPRFNVSSSSLLKYEKAEMPTSHSGPSCVCSPWAAADDTDFFSGWQFTKPSRHKHKGHHDKKRNRHKDHKWTNLKSDANSIFRHHTDVRKYMEEYRIYFTRGDVCKSGAEIPVLGVTAPDPYHAKMKSIR